MSPNKDKYFPLELFLTLSLLLLVVLLFLELAYNFIPFIVLGLAGGFCFSWFARSRPAAALKIAVELASVCAFFWIIYSVLNSTFFYSDIVLICVKGVLLLEVILSFAAATPGFLSYMQVLSIPLLMSYPVLVKGHGTFSTLVMLGYMVCWLAILRVRLWGLFNSLKARGLRRYYTVYLMAAVLLAAAMLSWILFSSIPLAQVRKSGLLPQRSEELDPGLRSAEREYDTMQDALQKDVTGLILSIEAAQDRYDILALLNSLIKDSSDVMEVYKAEQGLVSFLRNPGPGLEKGKGEELTILLGGYSDKKIVLNLRKIKENILEILKRNAFGIRERISILSGVNRMQRSSSPKEIDRLSKEISRVADGSAAASGAKKELKEMVEEFRGWKLLEIYRDMRNKLVKDSESFEAKLKAEARQLIDKIDASEKLSELDKLSDEIEKFKKSSATGQAQKFAEGARLLVDLKLEMILARESKELKESLDSPDIPQYKADELKERADNIAKSQDAGTFLEESRKLYAKLQEEGKSADSSMRSLVEAKTQILIKEKMAEIEKALLESRLKEEAIRDIMNDIEKLQSQRDLEAIIAETRKIESKIDKFFEQGFVSEKTKELLKKELEEISQLLAFSAELESAASGKEPSAGKGQDDYRSKWERMVRESSLTEEKKEAIAQLTEELFKAETVSQLKAVKEAMQKEIDELAEEKIKKDEIRNLETGLKEISRIKKAFLIEKELAALREKIEQLEKVNPEKAKQLQELVENIKEASQEKDLREEVEKLKSYVQSQAKELKEDVERLEKALKEAPQAQKAALIEKELAALREKIEQLEKVNPGKAKQLQELVENIKEASQEKDLREEVEKLKSYVESQEKELKEESATAKENASWQVYLMPSRLVMPIDSTFALKAIGIYNKLFVKEISRQMAWSSSDPRIAWVDEGGIVQSLSKGSATISARYKGGDSQQVEVTVVDKIPDSLNAAVMNEVPR